jgi:hypothetical protein
MGGWVQKRPALVEGCLKADEVEVKEARTQPLSQWQAPKSLNPCPGIPIYKCTNSWAKGLPNPVFCLAPPPAAAHGRRCLPPTSCGHSCVGPLAFFLNVSTQIYLVILSKSLLCCLIRSSFISPSSILMSSVLHHIAAPSTLSSPP